LTIALIAWRSPALARERDSARVVGFGVMWFIIAISPVSNALFLTGILLAERTLYLPSVGIAAATGWLVLRLVQERRRAGWLLLTVVVTFASLRAWSRNRTWKDSNTVFVTMMREQPHSGRSQWMLGDQFWGSGDIDR